MKSKTLHITLPCWRPQWFSGKPQRRSCWHFSNSERC